MANPFGPLSAAEFQEAVDAPYGGAATILRRFDPLWGKASKDGEPVRWKVTFSKRTVLRASTFVEAVTEEEADILAGQVNTNALSWDFDYDESEEVEDIELA